MKKSARSPQGKIDQYPSLSLILSTSCFHHRHSSPVCSHPRLTHTQRSREIMDRRQTQPRHPCGGHRPLNNLSSTATPTFNRQVANDFTASAYYSGPSSLAAADSPGWVRNQRFTDSPRWPESEHSLFESSVSSDWRNRDTRSSPLSSEHSVGRRTTTTRSHDNQGVIQQLPLFSGIFHGLRSSTPKPLHFTSAQPPSPLRLDGHSAPQSAETRPSPPPT